MPFTIPDNDESFNTNQSLIMQTDLDALVAGIGASGVISGCAVTAQGSPDMTVAVAAGEVLIGGAKALVAAGNVTITTADATNPRLDLVVVNSSGTKSVTAGTAAANPKAPDIPASSVLLAMVYVPATDTTIATNQITDKRVLVAALFPASRLVVSGTTYFALPGIVALQMSTQALSANQLRYFPFEVRTPITLDQLAIEVSTAGVAATTIRTGIFHMDKDGQPGALVVDAGTVAADSTGAKTASIGVTLQPGRYLAGLNTDGTPTVRTIRGGIPFTIVNSVIGATAILSFMRANSTYSAFATPGPAITVAGFGGSPFEHAVFLRISTP